MPKTTHRRRYRVLFWLAALIIVVLAIPIARFAHTVGTVVSLRLAGAIDSQSVSRAVAKLHSENVYVRDAAARRLGQIGSNAVPAIPDLLVVLRSDAPQAATSAAAALGHICHSSPGKVTQATEREVVAALIEALDHPDGEIRRYSAYAIWLIGPRASSAIPKLLQRLYDGHMAYMAARALGEMGARKSIPGLTKLLSSSYAGERAEAAVALSRLGPLPVETVAAIEHLLTDEEEFVRDAAGKALPVLQSAMPGTVWSQ